MFNANPKTMARVAAKVQRVLIIDPNPHAARLLADLCKELGSKQLAVAQTTERALFVLKEFEPDLVFTEFAAPDLDGVDFTRRMRRSTCSMRKSPVIMVTAEATAASIISARNAGVHEYLRKPFTAGDLFRRIENVALKPRLWIEAQMYVGPDRRRFNSEDYGGSRKRRADATPQADAPLAQAS